MKNRTFLIEVTGVGTHLQCVSHMQQRAAPGSLAVTEKQAGGDEMDINGYLKCDFIAALLAAGFSVPRCPVFLSPTCSVAVLWIGIGQVFSKGSGCSVETEQLWRFVKHSTHKHSGQLPFFYLFRGLNTL